MNTTQNITDARQHLDALLCGSPFVGYAYAYPHKTAYRPLAPPVALAEAWISEANEETALYVHIPFCEMRCGFCNLFTLAHPQAEAEGRYLDALTRQADIMEGVTAGRACMRTAFGGGTPTFLSPEGLERTLALAARFAPLADVPFSVETSPGTATGEKLAILKVGGVDRVSIGVQSFVEAEVRAVGRGQKNVDVFAALSRIRDAGFPTLNLDLMYGLPEQTPETWAASLREALRWQPEELYLYPLYVRPLTGLGKKAGDLPVFENDIRLLLFRQARERLFAEGYEQVSLRFFRRRGVASHPSSDAIGGNLLGLGCGARSYTRALHYSTEWAVGRGGVRDIIEDYSGRGEAEFSHADYGVFISADEQRRRYLVYSLLQQQEGVGFDFYQARFGTALREDFPHLLALTERGLATASADGLRLTECGWEWADVLGPWLTSDAMRREMERFSLR